VVEHATNWEPAPLPRPEQTWLKEKSLTPWS